MSSKLIEIFQDDVIQNKIKNKLPYLFAIAEIEASRAGKIGMEVGSIRERILIALLIYKFGQDNVDYELPITEREIDVKLFNAPISIKSITGLGGVKANWTVDAESARSFVENYEPKADILLAQINWGKTGYLYYIPLESQINVLKVVGVNNYLKLPKPGTNPRGVEYNKDALLRLQHDSDTKSIEIKWSRPTSPIQSYEAYRRWVDYWSEDL